MNTDIQFTEDDLLEVELRQDAKLTFLVVKETLTRIGIPGKDRKSLYQSCHILRRHGRYYVIHFKEALHILDGKPVNFDDIDRDRRTNIAYLLQKWNLLRIKNPQKYPKPLTERINFMVLSHRTKHEWNLVPKFRMGKNRPAS